MNQFLKAKNKTVDYDVISDNLEQAISSYIIDEFPNTDLGRAFDASYFHR